MIIIIIVLFFLVQLTGEGEGKFARQDQVENLFEILIFSLKQITLLSISASDLLKFIYLFTCLFIFEKPNKGRGKKKIVAGGETSQAGIEGAPEAEAGASPAVGAVHSPTVTISVSCFCVCVCVCVWKFKKGFFKFRIAFFPSPSI